MSKKDDFDDFLKQYIADVKGSSLLETSKNFARKLFKDYCSITDEDPPGEIIILDGSGDGGIDLAYFEQVEREDDSEGDTWYVVQSKYGKSFQGMKTLKDEAQKVFDTLQGHRQNLSHEAKNLSERIRHFIAKASERDQLVFVILTGKNFKDKDAEERILNDIRNMGKGRFGEIFDVEHYSVEKVFNLQSELVESNDQRIEVSFKANLIQVGESIFIGGSTLNNIFDFLKSYDKRTGNLDVLYDHNIRLFLQFRSQVNKELRETLEKEPENFGLYNNGITIAVEKIIEKDKGIFSLLDPKIVNGCQTTQTIYRVLQKKLGCGGTGTEPVDLADWRKKVENAMIVVKVVEVKNNQELLSNITHYTNSQNAVKKQDFIALTSGLKRWCKDMEEKYNIYLETQKGGWDAQKTLKAKGKGKHFSDRVNIFDLIKIYAAGWLEKAGLAYIANPPFAPGGKVFDEISDMSTQGEFDSQDLYIAYRLKKFADEQKFGRGAKKDSRRFTRYLFYMATVEMVKLFLKKAKVDMSKKKNITQALDNLLREEEIKDIFFDRVVKSIDQYMDKDDIKPDRSLFHEPGFKGREVREYLKNKKLGMPEYSTKFWNSLEYHQDLMTETLKEKELDILKVLKKL